MPEEEAPLDPQVSKCVTKLANLLRKSGSKVLSNSSSLSLSWPVYHQISTALSFFASHASDQGKYLDCKLVLDLEYLKSFLSRVPSLKLYHSNSHEFCGLICLGGLIHLRHLDLKRLPIHLIQDLDAVKHQLRSLCLSKCSVDLEQLLLHCLGSQPSPSPWSSLSHLTISHCALTSLSSAISYTPHLTHLDCSNNMMTTTPGLELLSNLSHLNLSFNKLSRIPTIHDSALLIHLSLAFNQIEQLSPISNLPYIEHLDVSGNCLMHHDVLAPISSLNKLLQIDLRHNPLSVHPKHRALACSWLNPSLASTSPVLDLVTLSRSELALVGSSRLIVSPPVSPASPVNETGDESISSVPFNLDDLPDSVSCTGSREGSMVSGYTVTTAGGTRKRKKGRRKKKIREAVITDEAEYTETETETTKIYTPNKDLETFGIGRVVAESVVTASTLVELRDKHGEDWLRSGVGDKIHSLLGIPDTETEKDTSTVIQTMVSKESDIERSNSYNQQSSYSHDKTHDLSKPGMRRNSDEVPDGTDQAECLEEKDISSTLDDMNTNGNSKETRVSTVSNISSDSQGIYSSYADRENSPGLIDQGSKVAVFRSIPGDDSGEEEKLFLYISSEFIREQDMKGATRVKWFLHSLEQFEMIGRVSANEKSEHVTGDRVKCALLFNTIRRDNRERIYTMSETSYSILMALAGPVLERSAVVNATIPSLQCVKCQSMFSASGAPKSKQGSICPNCGSSMIIECQTTDDQNEEEGVSLGIPACEMLDLAAITDTSNRASTPRMFSKESSADGGVDSQPEQLYLGQEINISPVKKVINNFSVTADIHNHIVKSPDTNLPDLLPRPEPKASRDSSDEEKFQQSKEKSSSPGMHRSESSSDISVLSNPSECSIEVLSGRGEAQLDASNVCDKNSAIGDIKSDIKMLESSSSGSMVNSVVASETKLAASGSLSNINETITGDRVDSPTSPSKTSRSTCSSSPCSPTKKLVDNIESVSIDEDSSVFHSCQEDTDNSLIEDPEHSSVNTVMDLSNTLSHESLAGSQCATPIPVTKTHLSTPLGVSPLTFTSKVDSPDKPSISPEPVDTSSPISWNYSNFCKVDHRVQLFCELTLFREEEDMLLLAKGYLHIRSMPNSVWPGVLVVTNKRIYTLGITGAETEEPSDWLELKSSANVQNLCRLIGLVGGQGVGLELQSNSKPVQPSFYRLSMVTGYSGEGSDCYYMIMGDRTRVDSMMDQLVEKLQESVRSTPIPITRLTQDEEAVISNQVARACPEAETRIELFQMANMIMEGRDQWERVSVIVTSSHIAVCRDFFLWLFTSNEKQLPFISVQKIENLNNLAIYQTWPERTRLDLADMKLRFKFETEAGVQELVGSLREVWELSKGVKLEVIFK